MSSAEDLGGLLVRPRGSLRPPRSRARGLRQDPRGLGIIPFMPGRVVPFVPDCYYHIYNRGNNRGAMFFEPENYIYFLHGMKRYLLP